MTSGVIFDLKRYAINDGPGIRTAVFMKGCPLSCWWCHNPEGQRRLPQLMVRANRCKASKACQETCPQGAISWNDGSITNWEACDQCGKCAEACYAGAREMVGREIDVGSLVAEIERDIPFYDQSGGGVTFTGGEPLLQRKFLVEALQACKQAGIHTSVDTSGYTSWVNIQSMLPLVDLFLYDVKLMDTDNHVKYTYVTNVRILDNLKRLSREKARIIVRMPLVPGVNDDEENLSKTGSFLASLPSLEGVEVMPYHETGVAKYQGLGMQYKMGNTPVPTSQQIDDAEGLFSTFGLAVIRHSDGRMK